MATGGVLGNGVKVAFSANSPVSWMEVNQNQLLDIGWPQEQSDKVNIDTHGSTSNYHKNMPGMKTVSDPFILVLTDMDETTSPDQATLRAARASGDKMWWRFEIPTDRARTKFSGIEFEASVLNYEPSVPIGDKQTTKFTLSFEGEGVYEDAAAGASQIA